MSGWTGRLTGVAACAMRLALPSLVWGQGQQDSADVRYRWAEKVDTSLAAHPGIPVSVDAMLAWKPADFGKHDETAPRRGLELHVYRLAGWIQRVEQNDDGDVHLSLTAAADASGDSCVVAEVPAVRYGSVYAKARAELLPILEATRIKQSGKLAVPVLVEVTGPAFFDGKHLERDKKHGKKSERAESHGDCNASASALWEIHPVYRVAQP